MDNSQSQPVHAASSAIAASSDIVTPAAPVAQTSASSPVSLNFAPPAPPPSSVAAVSSSASLPAVSSAQATLAPAVAVPAAAPAPAAPASTTPSVSFVFGGKGRTHSSVVTGSPLSQPPLQPILPAPNAPSAPESPDTISRKRKRRPSAAAVASAESVSRRTSTRHRSMSTDLQDDGSASGGGRRINYAESDDENDDGDSTGMKRESDGEDGEGDDDSAWDDESASAVGGDGSMRKRKRREDSGTGGNESDGDPPGMGSNAPTAMQIDSPATAAATLDTSMTKPISSSNGGRQRRYQELEDITYSVPKLFTQLVAEIANARSDLLYVRDDSTSKVASAYMHIVCAYRNSGCPFILKLTKAREGGWTLKSAGPPQPGEADPKARSNYNCLHQAAAKPGPIPAMPQPGDGFLPGEGSAKKPAPSRRKPSGSSQHPSTAAATAARIANANAKRLKQQAAMKEERARLEREEANGGPPAASQSQFAPPYQPEQQQLQQSLYQQSQQQPQQSNVRGSPKGGAGAGASASIKYRSSMGSSNFTSASSQQQQSYQDFAPVLNPEDRALAPPFKRSLDLANQLVPALSNGGSSQRSSKLSGLQPPAASGSRAPPLTTFSRGNEPAASTSRTHASSKSRTSHGHGHAHGHGANGTDHSYCCAHACPYERIVVAHLLQGTVAPQQPESQATASAVAHSVPVTSTAAVVPISERPSRLDLTPATVVDNSTAWTWRVFFEVYDADLSRSNLASALSSPLLGSPPCDFFKAAQSVQLALVDSLDHVPGLNPRPQLLARLSFRAKVASGEALTAWTEFTAAGANVGGGANGVGENGSHDTTAVGMAALRARRDQGREQLRALEKELEDIEDEAEKLEDELGSRMKMEVLKTREAAEKARQVQVEVEAEAARPQENGSSATTDQPTPMEGVVSEATVPAATTITTAAATATDALPEAAAPSRSPSASATVTLPPPPPPPSTRIRLSPSTKSSSGSTAVPPFIILPSRQPPTSKPSTVVVNTNSDKLTAPPSTANANGHAASHGDVKAIINAAATPKTTTAAVASTSTDADATADKGKAREGELSAEVDRARSTSSGATDHGIPF